MGENFIVKELRRPPTPYETFMRDEAVPVHGGIGVRDVRELPLRYWKRMGGQGAFINLDGTEAGGTSFYVVQVPAAGALNPERHIYEELFLVVEGRGTTEVWKAGRARKQIFEWQSGSLFAIPLNTYHRLVNSSSKPALLIGATNAPWVMNMFHNQKFVFENSFDFGDRYNGTPDYFRAESPVCLDPYSERPICTSNVIPDLPTCELPLDSHMGAGYRTFNLEMADNTLTGHVGEFPSGRYSKAHAHQSGPVLICLRGSGYSITWPMEAGTRPWEAKKGDLVRRQDYVPGGMVSAAPGGSNWFHQHFSVGKEPLRVLAVRYHASMKWSIARNDAEEMRMLHFDIKKGGRTIEYRDEDPNVRRLYTETLKLQGIEFSMPEVAYN
jgi:mannose-6-phosphate isomerase-like protein (cupin superfamily)